MSATAAALGLIGCRECGLVVRATPARSTHCARCGAYLRVRHEDSVARTAAFLVAAAVCYVPANVLPVLVYSTPGHVESDTIVDGVLSLYRSGSWFLALIVLVASVMIPVGKIGVLAWMCALVHLRLPSDLRQTTQLFRAVEFIGRWSMLDVFVDAFVVALIQLGPIMSVRPGPGVPFFAATAVLTMLAARAFDPRLLWDAHVHAPAYA
jgi:paraquat-inducible protein A